MKNIGISNLHEKDVEHFTSDFGLYTRRVIDKPFKKACNIFTNANIIMQNMGNNMSDEEYFVSLDRNYISNDNYDIKDNKNNIIVERYPKLNDGEPYIFVCNHTCPEDIETVLNIIDRNAYLILGSIESLKYNREMYLSFLNGMIPFDIMDSSQRKLVFDKMVRVLKTNSILIFPEGSHNYSPNNLINPLFDGPVNLALQTGRKIVAVSLLRDNENNISYIDVSNPIDVRKMNADFSKSEKEYVNELSSLLRDKMATAVYSIVERHFKPLTRSDYTDIEEYLRKLMIEDAFKKLKWDKDVFEAEYLTKKTKADNEYKSVVKTLSNLALNTDKLLGLCGEDWILKSIDYDNKDVVLRMRKHLLELENGSHFRRK